LPLFLTILIAIAITSAFSGCAEEKPDVVIVKVPANENQNPNQEIVCTTDDGDYDAYPDTKGEVPKITGTVERYGNRQYKVVLTIENTHTDDFVYDSARTELDTDQGDVIYDIDYYEGPNNHARHIAISKGNTKTVTIYTASINDLENVKESGEMTLRVALDLDGKEQCSLDATLPDYDNLNGRQNLQITEVRNINDN